MIVAIGAFTVELRTCQPENYISLRPRDILASSLTAPRKFPGKRIAKVGKCGLLPRQPSLILRLRTTQKRFGSTLNRQIFASPVESFGSYCDGKVDVVKDPLFRLTG